MFWCVFERFQDALVSPIFEEIAFGTINFGGKLAAMNPFKIGIILEPYASASQWCSFQRDCIKYVTKKRVGMCAIGVQNIKET